VDLRMREIFTLAQQEAEADSLMNAEMALFEVYRADSLQDFTELTPGVFYKELVAGKGLSINDTSMISLKIKGLNLQGEVFFPEEEKPLNFRLTDETGIPFNWNEALRLMKDGGKSVLVLTSPNAFGKRGFSMGNIGPYQTIKLELSVVKVAANARDFELFSIADYVKRKKITQKPYSNGLYHITEAKGEGETLKTGDRVMVHYVGKYLDNESVFDSSHQRGQPIEVVIDETEVIEGWHVALKKMKVGEKATLIIPSALGYGSAGFPPVIGPFAPLVFEIEVVAKL
jgi:FKBP-type peptidyl-prolyl cis-trans isomerase